MQRIFTVSESLYLNDMVKNIQDILVYIDFNTEARIDRDKIKACMEKIEEFKILINKE